MTPLQQISLNGDPGQPALGGAPAAAPGPPLPGLPRKAARKVALHFNCALLNCALVVLSPLVLKIGPLPEVLGVGTFSPCSRMQLANLARACVNEGLLRRAPGDGKRPPVKPPHFLMMAWY